MSFSLLAGIPPHPDTPSAGTLQPQSLPRLRRQMSGRANTGNALPSTPSRESRVRSREAAHTVYTGSRDEFRLAAELVGKWRSGQRLVSFSAFPGSGLTPTPFRQDTLQDVKHPKTLAGGGRAGPGFLPGIRKPVPARLIRPDDFNRWPLTRRDGFRLMAGTNFYQK